MPIEIRELIVESQPAAQAAPQRPAPVQPQAADVARAVAALHLADAVRRDRRRAD